METPVILPVKTLHGTNMESLQNDYVNAYEKVRNAMDAFMAIEFNARDYADINAFYKAKAQMIEQYKKLDDVYQYIETIASSI